MRVRLFIRDELEDFPFQVVKGKEKEVYVYYSIVVRVSEQVAIGKCLYC